MDTLTKFKEVRELLSDRSRWTQGSFARDERGKAVYEKSREACSWCLAGAFVKVTETSVEAITLLAKLGCNVPGFNDNHTHEEILAKIDEVIHGQNQKH